MMPMSAMQAATAAAAGPVERIATTFGVDWPHLVAQTISFGIVCVVLYLLAYKPILRTLETRRQLIATGLAHAEEIRAERASIDHERRTVLAAANADGQRLIEEARLAGARLQAEETRHAMAAAEQILQRAREAAERDRAMMHAELRREIGRLVVQTTASVTGKILTADDHRRLSEETARQLAAARGDGATGRAAAGGA
jgi:F-type H+-transporting ATPase subunit b